MLTSATNLESLDSLENSSGQTLLPSASLEVVRSHCSTLLDRNPDLTENEAYRVEEQILNFAANVASEIKSDRAANFLDYSDKAFAAQFIASSAILEEDMMRDEQRQMKRIEYCTMQEILHLGVSLADRFAEAHPVVATPSEQAPELTESLRYSPPLLQITHDSILNDSDEEVFRMPKRLIEANITGAKLHDQLTLQAAQNQLASKLGAEDELETFHASIETISVSKPSENDKGQIVYRRVERPEYVKPNWKMNLRVYPKGTFHIHGSPNTYGEFLGDSADKRILLGRYLIDYSSMETVHEFDGRGVYLPGSDQIAHLISTSSVLHDGPFDRPAYTESIYTAVGISDLAGNTIARHDLAVQKIKSLAAVGETGLIILLVQKQSEKYASFMILDAEKGSIVSEIPLDSNAHSYDIFRGDAKILNDNLLAIRRTWPENELRFYDLSNGQLVRTLSDKETPFSSIHSLVCHPDGDSIYLLYCHENQYVYNVSSDSFRKIERPFGYESSGTFSPDGRYFVGQGLGIWDTETNKLKYDIGCGFRDANHFAFSPNGKHLSFFYFNALVYATVVLENWQDMLESQDIWGPKLESYS